MDRILKTFAAPLAVTLLLAGQANAQFRTISVQDVLNRCSSPALADDCSSEAMAFIAASRGDRARLEDLVRNLARASRAPGGSMQACRAMARAVRSIAGISAGSSGMEFRQIARSMCSGIDSAASTMDSTTGGDDDVAGDDLVPDERAPDIGNPANPAPNDPNPNNPDPDPNPDNPNPNPNPNNPDPNNPPPDDPGTPQLPGLPPDIGSRNPVSPWGHTRPDIPSFEAPSLPNWDGELDGFRQ